jgi:hypothetical protein
MPIRDHVASSGNAFADLSLPEAKADLAGKIIAQIQLRPFLESVNTQATNAISAFARARYRDRR